MSQIINLLESLNYRIRSINAEDYESIVELEMTRPWMRCFFSKEEIKTKRPRLRRSEMKPFEQLFDGYMNKDYFWIVEKQDGEFCGHIQIDQEDAESADLHIQILDDVDIIGFGKELLHEFFKMVARLTSIEYLEVSLWDEKDRSKMIYEEAGYVFKKGELEITL